MSKTKSPTLKDYLSGAVPLPDTFSTGFKRDLETARELIRLRREAIRAEQSNPEEEHRLSA